MNHLEANFGFLAEFEMTNMGRLSVISTDLKIHNLLLVVFGCL